MDSKAFLVFVLLLSLIAFAYYVGAATDFVALSQSARTVIYALTGRNSAGNFAAYPTGAGLNGNVIQKA